MLSSVAVRAGELMATMLAAGIVVLAAAVTGVWWLRRRVRRRLGTINHAAAAAHAGWRWLLSQPVPDRRWLAVTRQRRTLWRAVSAAEHAMATAQPRKPSAPSRPGPPADGEAPPPAPSPKMPPTGARTGRRVQVLP